MNISPTATRVDFERQGTNVLISTWEGNWKEGSLPATYDYAEDTGVERLLFECEKAGFTVEMCDSFHGRALRGDITRVDILKVDGKWLVRKFPHGWTARTRPISERPLTDDEANAAIIWMKSNHWNVREFPDGARGWKGEVKPIRDASTIRHVRRQVEAAFSRGETDQRRQWDLAFDF